MRIVTSKKYTIYIIVDILLLKYMLFVMIIEYIQTYNIRIHILDILLPEYILVI